MNRTIPYLAALLLGSALAVGQAPEPAGDAADPVTSSSPQAEGRCPCGDSCPCGPGCQCGADCDCQLAVAVLDEPSGCSCPDCTCGDNCQCEAGECHCPNCPGNVEPPPYELTLYCTDHCAPCEVAKAHLVPWLAGYGWTVAVCHADSDDGISRFPTWVVTRDGREVHRWTGAAWSREGRAAVTANLRQAKGESVAVAISPSSQSLHEWINRQYRGKQSWELIGVEGMPIRAHLQDGSHGTHVWRDEQLNGLSQWELLCLHDATHRGLIDPREW